MAARLARFEKPNPNPDPDQEQEPEPVPACCLESGAARVSNVVLCLFQGLLALAHFSVPCEFCQHHLQYLKRLSCYRGPGGLRRKRHLRVFQDGASIPRSVLQRQPVRRQHQQ